MSGRHPRTLLDAYADIISKLYNGLRRFKCVNEGCSAIASEAASAQMTLQVLNESRSILDYIKFHLRVCVHAHCMYAIGASLFGFVTAHSTHSHRAGNKGF